MAKIGIFYGSTGGHTAKAARAIAETLSPHEAQTRAISEIDSIEDLAAYDNLILGSSTWGHGDLQKDWRDAFGDLEELDLSGKTIALFSVGDSDKHGESFADALAVFYDKLADKGANIVGFVSAAGYSFKSSRAVRDGKFVGLALDEINEPNKTAARIKLWAESIKGAFS